MKTNLNLLLDNTTEDLFKSLKSKYKIKILPDYDYSVNIIERKYRKNVATICYDQFNPRSDYFAHELLHIKIHSQNFRISKLIDKLFWDFPNVSQLWNREFRNLIGNIIEHEKMFNEYSKLGFKENEFVGDFYEKKCSIQEIEYKMNVCLHPSLDSLKYITAKFFLIKGTLDTSIDYQEELIMLSKLAPDLLYNFNSFWISLLEMKVPYNKEKQEKLVLNFLKKIETNYKKVK